jgi:metallo-beta-lactamase class B
MKQLFVTLLLLVFFERIAAQYTLRIEIGKRPGLHTADSIYIAGSFNGWNPGIKDFAFSSDSSGKNYIDLKNLPGGIQEFKLTRGSWSKVECSKGGVQIANRLIYLRSDTAITLTVAAWADDFPARPPVSTRSKNVFIADTAFFSPQLNRKKRVWIYLPEEYAFTKKRYPVVYMQDGQNVFDALTASFGEWGADEMMDSLKPRQKSIIVAIDHGGDKRLTEYNPYNSRFGQGEGDAYVDFIVKTLKPFIDARYRTIPNQKHTAIAGSSMGGLISFYAVLKYPDVFGSAGVFSPAFWIAPEVYQKIETSGNVPNAFYFVCGELEGREMADGMEKAAAQLQKKGAGAIVKKIVPGGRHNENFWRNEMYEYYLWLYKTQIR